MKKSPVLNCIDDFVEDTHRICVTNKTKQSGKESLTKVVR